ncbi:MAG: DegV family protein [Lachnospiraceae bacterium]|nr:DegV family protein [Lachnospiraceae bacterium]
MSAKTNYNYKIVVDSCCELPDEFKNDPRFQIVSLTLSIGDYEVIDDAGFDQLDFIKRVAESEEAARSACPSPDAFMEAYNCDAERVYVITLSSKLSGSYNSAMLGKDLFFETYGDKDIHVFDSESASGGETQLALKIIELEEKNLSFDKIVKKVEDYRDNVHTYFVLNTLDSFIKNGRLPKLKGKIVSTLNIKPIMIGVKGMVEQKGQGVGIRQALKKMVETIHSEIKDSECRTLVITHCNCKERAEKVRDLILAQHRYARCIIMEMRGVSTLYACDGGIIVTM